MKIKIPFEWKIKKLSNPSVTKKIKAGGTPRRGNPEYWTNGTVPFVKITDITNSNKFLTETEEKITENGLENSSAWIVEPDSILYSMYASYGEPIITKIPVATNQAIIALKPSNVDLDYLYYSLLNLKHNLIKYIRESTQKNLNANIVKNLEIPVPPLVEQRGIVEVLGTVDKCIRLTDEVIERAEELKQGLMLQLFTRGIGHTEYKETPLGEIPKTWKIMSLGDPSISKIIMGQSPPSSSYNSKGEGLPFLQGNAEFGYTFPKTTLYTTKPQKIAQENDILVSVRAPVGELNYTPYRLCIGRGLSAIRVNPTNLSNDFIYYYLKQNINRLHALSTGSTFKAIRKEELYSFKLPIPNMVEQHNINNILNNINDKILYEKENQQYFIKLKQGLMQQLLSGKIRVELKGDELHRIRDGREAHH